VGSAVVRLVHKQSRREEVKEVWFRSGPGGRRRMSGSGTDQEGGGEGGLVQEQARWEEKEVWFRNGPDGRRRRRSGSGTDQTGG